MDYCHHPARAGFVGGLHEYGTDRVNPKGLLVPLLFLDEMMVGPKG